MLKPLVTSFNVIGNGFKTLKEIQKSYTNIKNKMKQIKINPLSNLENAYRYTRIKTKRNLSLMVRDFRDFRSNLDEQAKRFENKGGPFGKLIALFSGGMLIKNAFEGATELEMQRTAISSMKGEKRANELMKFGVNFANITPYQTNEVLDAVKTLEIRGLDPTKYLEGIGNMSAMLGKPLEQGVEAILDAVTGEFERLKEFGITKKMLEEEISKGSFDNKGSLINQKKMFDDLMKYINKSYAGGMEKLSRTTIGLISSIKGIYGSFTNLLFTGSQTGEILDKSPLGVFRKEVLLPLADNMMKWQEDGTFTKWGEQFSQAFTKFYGAVKSGVSFLWKHREAIIALISGYIAFKTTLALINLAVMLTNPVGLATAAITALAGAFIYAYRNFEPFREFVLWIGEKAIAIFNRFGEIIKTAINNPLEATKMIFSDILELNKKIANGLFGGIVDLGSWAFEKVTNIGSSLNESRVERRENNKIKNNNRVERISNIIREPINQINTNHITQPIININGGDTAQVRKVIEDVLFENEIRRGER